MWGETGERGREEMSEEAHARGTTRGSLSLSLSLLKRVLNVRAATTIRGQGRSLLLLQSGDLSGMYYLSLRARYDDPSSSLSTAAALLPRAV